MPSDIKVADATAETCQQGGQPAARVAAEARQARHPHSRRSCRLPTLIRLRRRFAQPPHRGRRTQRVLQRQLSLQAFRRQSGRASQHWGRGRVGTVTTWASAHRPVAAPAAERAPAQARPMLPPLHLRVEPARLLLHLSRRLRLRMRCRRSPSPATPAGTACGSRSCCSWHRRRLLAEDCTCGQWRAKSRSQIHLSATLPTSMSTPSLQHSPQALLQSGQAINLQVERARAARPAAAQLQVAAAAVARRSAGCPSLARVQS